MYIFTQVQVTTVFTTIATIVHLRVGIKITKFYGAGPYKYGQNLD